MKRIRAEVPLIGWLSLAVAFAESYQTKEFSEAKQIGAALRFYANDHKGFLPSKLEALVPNYLPDNRIFANIQYLASGSDLKTLPTTAILLQTIRPDKTGAIVKVFPDLTVYGPKR